MIVLDQHTIRKIEPVILTAATTDRIFVNDPQTRSCLACVENSRACTRYGFNELAGERGDATHALQKIEEHSLAGENHASIMANHGDGLARPQTHTIKYLRMGCDFVVRSHRAIQRRIDVEN